MFHTIRMRFIWIALALLLASCSSTKLVNQWQEDNSARQAFTNILVVGISDEQSHRRTFEDIFSAKLRQTGIQATPGHELFTDTAKADEQTLLAAVKHVGANGVLMTRVVRVDTETRYTPGYMSMQPRMGYYGYYASSWAYYEPPRMEQYKVAILETNLWDADSKQLVWSGTTETFQPGNIRKEIEEFSSLITQTLAKNGLIPTTNK